MKRVNAQSRFGATSLTDAHVRPLGCDPPHPVFAEFSRRAPSNHEPVPVFNDGHPLDLVCILAQLLVNQLQFRQQFGAGSVCCLHLLERTGKGPKEKIARWLLQNRRGLTLDDTRLN